MKQKQHLSHKGGDKKPERGAQIRGHRGQYLQGAGRLGSKPFFITDLCDDSHWDASFVQGMEGQIGYVIFTLGEYGAMVCIAVLDDNNDRTMFSGAAGIRYPTFSDEAFQELFSEDAVIFTRRHGPQQ